MTESTYTLKVHRSCYAMAQSHLMCTAAHAAHLLVDGDHLGAGLELELPHADEVLVYFGQPLLVLVLQVLGKELQLRGHRLQRLATAAMAFAVAECNMRCSVRADGTDSAKSISHHALSPPSACARGVSSA
jgi:hypothetical protein